MEIVHLKAKDQHQIRTALLEPLVKPKAVIQFVHGFGEAIEHFSDLAEILVSQEYAFVVHDQRGFGIEAKQKGVHGAYSNFLDDIDVVRSWIDEKFTDIPVVLFGFSMGGNIASNRILQRGEKNYSALILESPWFGLYKNPNPFLVLIARVFGKISGRLRINSGIDTQVIMRDKERLNAVLHDGIYHTTISLRLFTEVREQGLYALENAGKIQLPTLLLAGGQDQIVSLEAIRDFAKKSGENIEYHEFPESYHCVHYDWNAAEMRKVLMNFLNQHFQHL